MFEWFKRKREPINIERIRLQRWYDRRLEIAQLDAKIYKVSPELYEQILRERRRYASKHPRESDSI